MAKTLELTDKQRAFWLEVLGGNEDAVEMAYFLMVMSNILDDMVDRDNPVAEHDAIRAFRMALIELPRNRFYSQHFSLLNPILENGFTQWIASLVCERSGDEHQQELGHYLRYGVANVIAQAVMIIHGWEKAAALLPTVYAITHGERLREYLEELKHAKAN